MSVFVAESRITGGGRGVFVHNDLIKDSVLTRYGDTGTFPSDPSYVIDSFNGKKIMGEAGVYSVEMCAHLINDAAILRLQDSDHVGDIVLKMQQYCQQSTEGQNTYSLSHPEGGVFFRASRDLKQGEELYFSYGLPYWLTFAMIDIARPMVVIEALQSVTDVLHPLTSHCRKCVDLLGPKIAGFTLRSRIRACFQGDKAKLKELIAKVDTTFSYGRHIAFYNALSVITNKIGNDEQEGEDSHIYVEDIEELMNL
jgi:hypothetical protein